MLFRMRFGIIFLCLSCVLVTRRVEAVTPQYRFVYINGDSTNSGLLTFKGLNFNGADEILFTVQANQYIQTAYPSPDGKWVVLGYGYNITTHGDGRFRLVDVLKGEIRDIGGTSDYTDDLHYREWPPEVLWSPNSRYIAYTSRNDSPDVSLLIYDVQTGKQTVVGVDHDHMYMAWSHDSARLVVEAKHCTNNACYGSFDIYGPTKYLTSVKFEPLDDLSPNSGGWEPCNISWSPDDKVISFVWGCDYTSFWYVDVYLIDPQLHRILPVTHVERELGKNDIGYSVRQSLLWINDNTMLIGTYGENMIFPDSTLSHNVIERTVRYPDGKKIFDKAVVNWSLHSSSGRVTYRFLSQDESANNSVGDLQLGVFKNDSIIQTASIPHIPSYAHLAWSPDGSILLVDTMRELLFINPDSGAITTLKRLGIRVGWIVTN